MRESIFGQTREFPARSELLGKALAKRDFGQACSQRKDRLGASVRIPISARTIGSVWTEWVSVAMEESSPQEWKEKVYKPNILNKWNNIYKKPDMIEAI